MQSRFLSLALACAAFVAAQEVTFKVSSNLVVVNLTVRDKSGDLITNLKKDDFTIFEDGKPQKLAVFEVEKLDSDVLPALPPPDRQPRALVERTQPAAPAPAAAAAPSGPKRYQDRRLLALFFDFSSMPQTDQLRATQAAEKFIREQMTAADMVEIMVYTNRFKIVQDFTNDRDLLFATIRQLSLGEGADLAVEGTTGPDDDDDSGAFVADDTEFNIFNTDRKLSALEDAARKLAIFPEKKALVYFSSGVGKTGMENQSQLRSTINAAVRANVSFYPVDARGLVATAPAGDATQASPSGRTGVYSGSSQRGMRDKFNDQQETLYSLAADTGGKALLDSNDLTLGIQQAQKGINSYYILGYYSTNEARDGRFRRIQVKLNPRIEAKLDYRSGYYASKVWAKFNAADKERQLEEALELGDPVSELPLAIEVDYFRVTRDQYFVPVSVKIPGSVLALARKGNHKSTEMDFIGQVRDKAGKLVAGVRDSIPVKLSQENAGKLSKRRLEYDTGLTLPPGEYTLKFLARENLTGKMGTFEMPFVVPDLNAQGKGLRVSSVVWSNQREPLTSVVGSAENNKKLLADHPLIADGQKLLPSITRVFRRDQSLFVYFEVYDPTLDANRKLANLTADLVLFQGGRKLYESAPLGRSELKTARRGVVPFLFQIPLAKMPPGMYVSQVNIIDELARKFAFPRSTIVVLPDSTQQAARH